MASRTPGVALTARQIRLNESRCLRDISFSVPAGAHAITGPNGSGKSSLLLRIAAVRLEDVDVLTWDGHDARAMSVRQRALIRAAVLTNQRPQTDLTCVEYVSIGSPAPRVRTRLSEAITCLEAVGFEQQADQPVRTLSAGEWAWVRLAQAAASRPSVLLLDEIDAAIDAESRGRLYESARSISQTVIAVSHDVASVRLWADTVWEIADSRLVPA